jgi:tetratricopeptide (TPR) repeat protein
VLLSAALIVRDESRCLARCLNSLVGIVDEVVVVDTGSHDDSVAIAESFGARVFHRPWDGNFSAARNYGLDQVRGDWVLYIDADEWLQPIERSEVERALSDTHTHIGFRIRLRHQKGFTAYYEYRLWQNRPGIRFQGVIHESIVSSIHQAGSDEHLPVGLLEMLLEHDGYEGDQRHKHERNLPLLLEQVNNDPKRTYLWDHIGRIRHELGQEADARAAWQRGIELVRTNGVREHADCLVYFDLIVSNAQDNCPDAALLTEANELFPDNVLLYWGAALNSVARAEHRETIGWIDKLLAVPNEITERNGIAINERILNEWAFHARGMAEFKIGDFQRAAHDFAVAEAAAPEVEEYRIKRLLAEARVKS